MSRSSHRRQHEEIRTAIFQSLAKDLAGIIDPVRGDEDPSFAADSPLSTFRKERRPSR
jgi:hypothetical protein